MSPRLIKAGLILLILNLTFLVLVYAEADWITKINGEAITAKEFNEAYESVVLFGALNAPKLVSKKEITELINDKEQRKVYLRSFQDEYLIIQKAKAEGLINEKEIDAQSQKIAKLIKRQIILKEFLNKSIASKVKEPKASEINDIYNKEKKSFGDTDPKEAKKYIKEQLKNQKIQQKYVRYVENLRLKSVLVDKLEK